MKPQHNNIISDDLAMDEILRRWEYSPETGDFTRISKNCSRCPVGTVSKDKDTGGYRILSVFLDGHRYRYRAHRVVYYLMTGHHPEFYVDHINRVRHDNRWSNLRDATPSQNSMNSRKPHNKLGHTGIRVKDDGRRFIARIKVDNKEVHLGSFYTIDDAILARKSGEIKYFGDYA